MGRWGGYGEEWRIVMKSIVGKEEEQEDCEAGAWERMRKPCELHKCMNGFTPQSAKCGYRVTLLFCCQVWMQKPIPLSLSPHIHILLQFWSGPTKNSPIFLFSLSLSKWEPSPQAGRQDESERVLSGSLTFQITFSSHSFSNEENPILVLWKNLKEPAVFTKGQWTGVWPVLWLVVDFENRG